ncbi:acyl-CoA dehydrogenase family protein [Pseudonocardia yunnanensis]|uniref:Acyl-CoA dehydrogenase family protein n=1 Tax=Pseudonocardia yunnanensis TaxID=58107 RepID=A0ABW4ER64_9PSEU
MVNARRRDDHPCDVAPGEGELRGLLSAGELELPLPRGGRTAERWSGLAGWGRRDLGLARLVEGHTDAVAILAEAARHARPETLYGVWASRSGGTGARLVPSGDGLGLHGTVRFCSGAHTIDRALVVADAPEPADGHVLVEIAVDQPGLVPEPDTWATAAMAAADTVDVRFDGVPVSLDALVGPAGWYTTRSGFAAGGGGVAAVWWGGAVGLLDRAVAHLRSPADPHQLAHLGELHALMEAAFALLQRTADALDAAPGADHTCSLSAVRCAVERATREVVERVPRMVGAAALSRDGALARTLADLSLYIRQHHGERDHAALGASVLAMWAAR